MTTSNNTREPDAPTTTSYVYFVAIQFFRNGGLGFTNCEIPLAAKVTGLADIQMLEKHFRSEGFDSALVMGYNLLRTEQVRR
ncbi:MAG TPA: hypothetical protein VGB74_17385 [Actinoplanes sp.]|jgi:hypothetical protein